MTSPAPLGLPEKMVTVHQALADAEIHHAFGGALALAWCTQRARGTIDLDVNVFVPPDRSDLEEMLAAGTLDVATVAGVLVRHLGSDDERIVRLQSLA